MSDSPLPAPRVLVIDDSLTVRRYYRRIVEDAGFPVDEATNGLEALEYALAGGFGLFIVDVNMPMMDGYRFLAEARRRPEIAAVPAIVVSSDVTPADRAHAYASGANMHCEKPVEAERRKGILALLLGERCDA